MNKREKAQRLYDAMGFIDDILVYEALTYKKQRSSFSLQRLSVVLTALMLCVISVIVIRSGTLNKDSDNEPNDGPDSFSLTLEKVLSDAQGEYFAKAEDIDLFDGQSKFVIYDGERYKEIPISASAAKVMQSFSHSGSAYIPDTVLRIWLCDGQGLVISPCLKLSQGNIGYNTLFDYAPEIEPSAAFSEYVNTLV